MNPFHVQLILWVWLDFPSCFGQAAAAYNSPYIMVFFYFKMIGE